MSETRTKYAEVSESVWREFLGRRRSMLQSRIKLYKGAVWVGYETIPDSWYSGVEYRKCLAAKKLGNPEQFYLAQ